jgi:UDP-N-acetylglucosamine 4,6-dehydratase/5-epimerase
MSNILITGGAGSLGKAFTELLKDNQITCIDNSEWASVEYQATFNMDDDQVIITDFADFKWKPNQFDLLIHLAALKHVDKGEKLPKEYIENNLVKTIKLYDEADRNSTQILFVSTDKAVEPISAYGFTKALGERLTWQYGGSVARLGNILASNGSVIPLWEKAIAEGKPIPITDKEMKRYFITAEEAVKYIWEHRKEHLIIPPCKEVTIWELLGEVLDKHGYKEIADYKPGVDLIGIRQGEKIAEKLRWDYETNNS